MTQRHVITGLRAGQPYEVRVRAIAGLVRGPFATAGETGEPDTTPPGVPTGLATTGVLRGIALSWINPTDPDLKWVEIQEGPTASGAWTTIGQTGGTSFLRAGLTPAQSLWFRVRAVDASGNASAWTAAVQGTASLLVADDITQGIIDTAAFAAGIEPVGIVASLPSAKASELVLLTANGRLYRWDGAEYVPAVPLVGADGVVDLSSLPVDQLGLPAVDELPDDLGAADEGRVVYLTTDGKLYRWTGTEWTSSVTAAALDGVLSAANFPPELRPIERVPSLPAAGNFQGRVVFLTTDGKLYRWTSSSVTSGTDHWVRSVAAADITGQLADSQIEALAAAKVTGQLTDAQLAAIAAAKVTGQITDAQIADMAAAKVTGQLVDAQIATLGAGKITGQLTDAQIAAVAAAKVTGQITGTQITDGAVSTPKLAAGAVTTATLAAGAVTTATLAAEAVTAANIAAGTITASRLNLVDAVNYWPDWDLVDEALWTTTGVASFTNTGLSQYGRRRLRISENSSATSAWFRVEPGRDYLISLAAGRQAGSLSLSASLEWGALATDGTITALSSTALLDAITSPINTRHSVTATAPSTARAARWVFTAGGSGAGAMTWGGQLVRLRANAELIVDGAVIADKIAAGAITAGKIAAGAVEAGNIAAGAVVAETIAAGAITTTKIAAGAVEAANISAGAIGAVAISAGAITAEKIAAGAVETAALAAGSVTTDELAAGSVTTDRIAANSVTASRLVLTEANLWPDYDGLDPEFYALVGGGTFGFDETSGVNFGRRLLRIDSSATLQRAESLWLPVQPGAEYRAEIAVGLSAAHSPGATALVQLGTMAANGAVTITRTLAVGTRTATGAARFGLDFVAASDERRLRVLYQRQAGTGGAGWFGGTIIRRRASAALIVDGAILADKLAANSVTTAKLAAGAVTADKIAANSITAGQIAAGAISSTEIAAGAIQAGNLASSTLITQAAQMGSAVITTAAIQDLTVNRFKIIGGGEGVTQSFSGQTGAITTTVRRPGSANTAMVAAFGNIPCVVNPSFDNGAVNVAYNWGTQLTVVEAASPAGTDNPTFFSAFQDDEASIRFELSQFAGFVATRLAPNGKRFLVGQIWLIDSPRWHQTNSYWNFLGSGTHLFEAWLLVGNAAPASVSTITTTGTRMTIGGIKVMR